MKSTCIYSPHLFGIPALQNILFHVCRVLLQMWEDDWSILTAFNNAPCGPCVEFRLARWFVWFDSCRAPARMNAWLCGLKHSSFPLQNPSNLSRRFRFVMPLNLLVHLIVEMARLSRQVTHESIESSHHKLTTCICLSNFSKYCDWNCNALGSLQR